MKCFQISPLKIKKIKKNRLFKFKSRNKLVKLFLIILLLNTLPAFAYAGPGVAIGAIIVFLTVILTFFGSLILTVYSYVKKTIQFLYKKITKKNNKSNKKNRK
tara:strand:- start:171 stop:479 length:309 start_codon:yes stop_codon:yes gene_type:complete